MTSTLTPPGAAPTERAPRPTLIADLLPTEIVQARRARQMRRWMLIVVAACTVVLVAWCGLTTYRTSQARSDLDRAQQQADLLRARQQSYSEVVTLQSESEQIGVRLNALLATDLQWTTLLSTVQQLAPQGVQLTAINGLLTDRDAAAVNTTELPNTSGKKLFGTVTVTGMGASKALIASYVDGLGRLAGLGNPLISGVTLTDGALQFTVRLDITESMLGGRYTTKGGEH